MEQQKIISVLGQELTMIYVQAAPSRWVTKTDGTPSPFIP